MADNNGNKCRRGKRSRGREHSICTLLEITISEAIDAPAELRLRTIEITAYRMLVVSQLLETDCDLEIGTVLLAGRSLNCLVLRRITYRH